MLSLTDIDEMEKLIGQLKGYHEELTTLMKKSPKDAVNEFKLKFINKTLERCNNLLDKKYKPFEDFNCFNSDDVPSNSDVTFIISQYMQAIEKLRSDHIYLEHGSWYYRIKNSNDKIRTSPPAKLQEKGNR